MRTIRRFLSVVLGGAVMTAALVGCASIDLGPDDNAPPVQFPGQTAGAPVPGPVPASRAQPLPVVSQNAALPPAGGVGSDAGASGVPDANAHLVTLTTRLDGASAVPPTDSGASAQFDAVYDNDTHLLRWKVTWHNLSSPITAVRFYGPAAPGQQGPAALIWPGPFGASYEGRATLAPPQAANLLGGLWYINVQTVNYPTGELRGQLRVVY